MCIYNFFCLFVCLFVCSFVWYVFYEVWHICLCCVYVWAWGYAIFVVRMTCHVFCQCFQHNQICWKSFWPSNKFSSIHLIFLLVIALGKLKCMLLNLFELDIGFPFAYCFSAEIIICIFVIVIVNEFVFFLGAIALRSCILKASGKDKWLINIWLDFNAFWTRS